MIILIINTEDLVCLTSVVHGWAVFLAQHLQQFAFLSFPSFVILELPLPLLVCGDLRLFVVLEGPVLGPTQVPGLQQDLPGRVLLRHNMDRQLVILQDSWEKYFETDGGLKKCLPSVKTSIHHKSLTSRAEDPWK